MIYLLFSLRIFSSDTIMIRNRFLMADRKPPIWCKCCSQMFQYQTFQALNSHHCHEKFNKILTTHFHFKKKINSICQTSTIISNGISRAITPYGKIHQDEYEVLEVTLGTRVTETYSPKLALIAPDSRHFCSSLWISSTLCRLLYCW